MLPFIDAVNHEVGGDISVNDNDRSSRRVNSTAVNNLAIWPGVGFTKLISTVPFFPYFLPLSKTLAYVLSLCVSHSYLTGIATAQLGMAFVTYECEFDERSFSNPCTWSAAALILNLFSRNIPITTQKKLDMKRYQIK